ncbi:hypothetical protein YN1_2710 [Nanoarchaeota archaeon]
MNKIRLLYLYILLLPLLNIIFSQSNNTSLGTGTVLNPVNLLNFNIGNISNNNFIIGVLKWYAPILYNLAGSPSNFLLYLIGIMAIIFFTIRFFIRDLDRASGFFIFIFFIAIIHFIFTFLPGLLIIGGIIVLFLIALFSRFLEWTHNQTRFIRRAFRKMKNTEFRYLFSRLYQPMNSYRYWLSNNYKRIDLIEKNIDNNIIPLEKNIRKLPKNIKDKDTNRASRELIKILDNIKREHKKIDKEFRQIISNIQKGTNIRNSKDVIRLTDMNIINRSKRLRNKIKKTTGKIKNYITKLKHLEKRYPHMSPFIESIVGSLVIIHNNLGNMYNILNYTESFENNILNQFTQYAKFIVQQEEIARRINRKSYNLQKQATNVYKNTRNLRINNFPKIGNAPVSNLGSPLIKPLNMNITKGSMSGKI